MGSDDKKEQRLRLGSMSKYLAAHWRGLLIIFLVTLLSSAGTLLQPLPLKLLVDHGFDGKPLPDAMRWLTGSELSTSSVIVAAAVSGLIIYLLQSVATVVLTFLWVRVGQKMIYELMGDVFQHVQRLSLRFHQRHEVGDTMSRVTGDTWAIYTVVDSLLFTPIRAITLAIAMAIVMFEISVSMTLLAFAAAPVMAVGSFVFGKKIRKVAREKREAESRVQSHVQQTLAGLAVTRAFGQEERMADRFIDTANTAIGAFKRSTLAGNFYNLFAGGLNSFGAGIVLFVGAGYVLGGELSTGNLLVFVAYLNTLQTQMKQLVETYGSVQTSSASLDRVAELMDTRIETISPPRARSMTDLRPSIEFRNVTFGYDVERPVLGDVSLRVEAGQTVALVGPSGSGKSTLASLVPRFYEPDAGSVLIGDVDIRKVSLEELRKRVALVLQEPFLFPISIAENIRLGLPGAELAKVEEAARAAKAHDFIMRLPERYETVIGEGGSTLSGGEKQRIAIARAFLKDAPILILDEPTSSLDTVTEAALLETLDELAAGRTTIVIAHRLSTVRRADQIVVIEAGRIAEQGTHRKLLQTSGIYASLYQHQTGAATA